MSNLNGTHTPADTELGNLGSELEQVVDQAVLKLFSARITRLATEQVDAIFDDPGMEDLVRQRIKKSVTAQAEPEAEPEAEPIYADVFGFVDNIVLPIHRVDAGPGDESEARWCEHWWLHGKALAYLRELHKSWEHKRLGKTDELLRFFLDDFERVMRILLDPSGPFKRCVEGHAVGTKAYRQLPSATPPDALRSGTGDEPESGPLIIPAPGYSVRERFPARDFEPLQTPQFP